MAMHMLGIDALDEAVDCNMSLFQLASTIVHACWPSKLKGTEDILRTRPCTEEENICSCDGSMRC